MILVTCALFAFALPCAADAQSSETRGMRAFGVEAAGGIAGSVAGVAVGLAISRPDLCGVDDLACTIRGLGAAGIGSVVGATAGTMLAGRSANSRPSLIGALLGSIGGAVAGVGLVHALTEEANLKLEKPVTIAVYSLTQGIVTALASRLVATLRR